MPSTLKAIKSRLTDEQWAAFVCLMESTGFSQAELIRRALAVFVAQRGEDDSVWYDTPPHGGRRSSAGEPEQEG